MKLLGKLVYGAGACVFFVGVVPAFALFLGVGYCANKLFGNRNN